MRDNRESLQRAVDLIKKTRAAKGKTVTEEEMAGKLNLSAEQFQAYLNGDEETPDALSSRLKAAWGIGSVMIESTKRVRVREYKEPTNEAERRERDRNSLKATIRFIESVGKDGGRTITQEEMAGKIGVLGDRLAAYLKGEEPVPDDLTGLLLTAYDGLIKSHRSESSRNFLELTLVMIRNRGLAAGRDISLDEMAAKAGLSEEQLYIYLAGEQQTPDDLASPLRSAYKDLLKDGDATKIKENIYLDKKARRVKLL